MTELGGEAEDTLSSLFPLRAGFTDIEAKDQLFVKSILRDSVVFMEIEYTINSNPSLIATDIIVSKLNGDLLPDWLRVNEQGKLISGVPPLGVDKMELRIEVRLSDKTAIIRYVDLNMITGEVLSLQEPSSGPGTEVIAESSLFENQIEKEAVKFQESSDNIAKSLIN